MTKTPKRSTKAPKAPTITIGVKGPGAKAVHKKMDNAALKALDSYRRKPGKLDAAKRKALPKSKFALPAERKYPIENASHAANAKSRATQQFEKGNLSQAQRAMIDMKANEILRKGK